MCGPVRQSSYSGPRWMWQSIAPGSTILPRASMTRSASGSMSAGASAAILSPLIPTATSSTSVAVTTCPPRTMRSSFVAMVVCLLLHARVDLRLHQLGVDLFEQLRVEHLLGRELLLDAVERVQEIDELAHALHEPRIHLHRVLVEGHHRLELAFLALHDGRDGLHDRVAVAVD